MENRKKFVTHKFQMRASDLTFLEIIMRNQWQLQLLQEIFLFLKFFCILFPELSYPELALSTEIHVTLAVMEVFL